MPPHYSHPFTPPHPTHQNQDSEFAHDNPEYTAALRPARPPRPDPMPHDRYDYDDGWEEQEEEGSDNLSAVRNVKCWISLRST
jgi:hypothetical protein